MAKVFTAHLGKGKKIPQQAGGNVVFIDITVKSGKFFKEDLAPTWDMLKAYKETGDEEKYTEEYMKRLRNMSEECKRALKRMLYDGRDIVLACYCGTESFCHRHLLKNFLIEFFGFEDGGEVEDVNPLTKRSGNYLMIANFKHEEWSEDIKALVHGFGDVELVEQVNPQGQAPMNTVLNYLQLVDERARKGITTVDISNFCTFDGISPMIRPSKTPIGNSVIQLHGGEDLEQLKASIIDSVDTLYVSLEGVGGRGIDSHMFQLYETYK